MNKFKYEKLKNVSQSQISDITNPTMASKQGIIRKTSHGEAILATWSPTHQLKREYKTEIKDSLSTTASIANYNEAVDSSTSSLSHGFDKHRKFLGSEAIRKLENMAVRKYGSVENMFKTVIFNILNIACNK